jgi:hypothetical protein
MKHLAALAQTCLFQFLIPSSLRSHSQGIFNNGSFSIADFVGANPNAFANLVCPLALCDDD